MTHALVEAQAQAGMGQTGDTCLRVLETTLGYAKDQIYPMVDDLLEELEMNGKQQAIAEVEVD